MVMKAGYHGGKMMLIAPVPIPAYDVSDPSIMMVTTYDSIRGPTGPVGRVPADRPMTPLSSMRD